MSASADKTLRAASPQPAHFAKVGICDKAIVRRFADESQLPVAKDISGSRIAIPQGYGGTGKPEQQRGNEGLG